MSHANDERPEIDPCFQSPRKQGFTLILFKIHFISATRWTFWNRQCYSNLSKEGSFLNERGTQRIFVKEQRNTYVKASYIYCRPVRVSTKIESAL